MRKLGRTVTAFTILTAIAALSPAIAQTQLERADGGDLTPGDPAVGVPAVGVPAVGVPAVGVPAVGVPAVGVPAAGVPAPGVPAPGVPSIGAPVASAPAENVPLTVAPMAVAQVTVAPTAPTLAPSAPIAPLPRGPAPIVAVPVAVYVTNFVAVPANASAAGLLARLRTALHAHAAGHDAGLVAQAVVQRLNQAGVAARYLTPGDQPPVTGWLIGGVFHLRGDAPAAASESATSDEAALGADVSVSVADLEHGPDTPFAIIGVPPAAAAPSGERAWAPYVVPAKLSFEQADRNAAVAALAQQIADVFVGNMTALRQADAKAIAP